MKIGKLVAGGLASLILTAATGCQTSPAQKLGQAWVVHNETTNTMAALTEEEVVSKEDAQTFLNYEARTLTVLDAATESIISGDGDIDDLESTVEFIGPLLGAMEEIVLEMEDE